MINCGFVVDGGLNKQANLLFPHQAQSQRR